VAREPGQFLLTYLVSPLNKWHAPPQPQTRIVELTLGAQLSDNSRRDGIRVRDYLHLPAGCPRKLVTMSEFPRTKKNCYHNRFPLSHLVRLVDRQSTPTVPIQLLPGESVHYLGLTLMLGS